MNVILVRCPGRNRLKGFESLRRLSKGRTKSPEISERVLQKICKFTGADKELLRDPLCECVSAGVLLSSLRRAGVAFTSTPVRKHLKGVKKAAEALRNAFEKLDEAFAQLDEDTAMVLGDHLKKLKNADLNAYKWMISGLVKASNNALRSPEKAKAGRPKGPQDYVLKEVIERLYFSVEIKAGGN
jgi:hypothetical protein